MFVTVVAVLCHFSAQDCTEVVVTNSNLDEGWADIWSPQTKCRIDGPPLVIADFYPQFHIRPIGVWVQHGPKLPPL